MRVERTANFLIVDGRIVVRCYTDDLGHVVIGVKVRKYTGRLSDGTPEWNTNAKRTDWTYLHQLPRAYLKAIYKELFDEV